MGVIAIPDVPGRRVDERMETLKRDAREIIRNRIALCEVTDSPYPTSRTRSQLMKALCYAVMEYRMNSGIEVPSTYDLFKIESRKIDGVIHWYVRFKTELWDAAHDPLLLTKKRKSLR